jgi:hypothetical protein
MRGFGTRRPVVYIHSLRPRRVGMARMFICESRYATIQNRINSAGYGIIAEVGVAWGGVVERISREFPQRTIFAYDTFTGLPREKWQEGELPPGEFYSEDVEARLGKLPNVIVRKGLFPGTLKAESGFAVVHLDVDYYQSTKEALVALLPRMMPYGRIILDDWKWSRCPGVERAVNELGLKAFPTGPTQAEIICG